MFIEIVVEGPVQRQRYQRCWIRRIATGTSLAGLVAHDLQGEADWRCLCLEVALRRSWSGGETKSHGHDFRCHYLSLTGGFRGRRFKICQLYLCLRPLRPPPLQPRLELRPICSRYFEALGAIMMPSHDIGVQGRALCSDRRSTCDCSRGAASRYLVGSSPRLTRSTAHRAIACGVSCHSPRRISCGVS